MQPGFKCGSEGWLQLGVELSRQHLPTKGQGPWAQSPILQNEVNQEMIHCWLSDIPLWIPSTLPQLRSYLLTPNRNRHPKKQTSKWHELSSGFQKHNVYTMSLKCMWITLNVLEAGMGVSIVKAERWKCSEDQWVYIFQSEVRVWPCTGHVRDKCYCNAHALEAEQEPGECAANLSYTVRRLHRQFNLWE